MAEMGFKCYRMSICWSRIFLNGDDEIPNEKGLEFYDHIFDELVKYHIIPIVTLYSIFATRTTRTKDERTG